MTCPSCLTARQRADHADYRPGCSTCLARQLCHMPAEQREACLDLLQHRHGYGARAEAIRLINLERARIRCLRKPRHP